MTRLVGTLVALVGAVAMPAAAAADNIYWSDSGAPGKIRVGNLEGGPARDLYSGENKNTRGIVLDPASGKIYWTVSDSGKIRVGSLDGRPARDLYTGEGNPQGLALDPASGKLYWIGGGAIRVGDVSGGPPHDLYPGENGLGLTVDPPSGKLYWTGTDSKGDGSIRVGSVSGGAPRDLYVFTPSAFPLGIALDPASGKLYWADHGSHTIRAGDTSGGAPRDLYTGESGAYGVAIDPAAGKLYWADEAIAGRIRVGSVSGGTAQDLFSGEFVSDFVALLRSPQPTAIPAISGSGRVNQPLSCTNGSWAPDLSAAFLYRAPESFSYQWLSNGAPIAGATSKSYVPSGAGSYSCRVTASNAGGATSQISHAVVVKPPKPTITKLRRNRHKHRAQVKFKAAGASRFQCALIRREKHARHKPKAHFKPCKSPKTYRHLKRGKYTFEVQALSGVGAGPIAKRNFRF